MNYRNMFLERLYQQFYNGPKLPNPVTTANKEDNGTDINTIEKYYVVKS